MLPEPERQMEAGAPRGRKLYLHNLAVNGNELLFTMRRRSNQNASMELIDKGRQFAFGVFLKTSRKSSLAS
jgi:hypothetical protein